jgi:N-acyl amino acid synthase of PEP-CTERM/exosortase system
MIVPDLTRANAAPDAFTPHFTFGRLATGGDRLATMEVFALRYQVYCLECGFLDPTDYADGLETDEFDAWSTHFTATNLAGELVGSVRLVQPPAGQAFPFQARCTALFENVELPPGDQCAEVSRLVVRESYRRRAGDTLAGVPKEFITGSGPFTPTPRSTSERRSNSPEILLGLYREMYQFSLRTGRRYWYAAMERSLARALSRLQFVFTPIGMETDYYGPVTPYLADLRELERRLDAHNPALLAWFRKGA